MAKKMLSVCDVCGGPTSEGPYRFGWDLTNYEIDLCEEHGIELVEVMENLLPHARRLGAKPTSIKVQAPAPSPRQQATTAEVRAWAKKNRIKVSDRGRIPDEIFERYLSAKRK